MKNRSVLHFQSIRQALKEKDFPVSDLLDIGDEPIIPVKIKTAAKSGDKEDLDKAEQILFASLPGKEILGNTVIAALPSECILLKCPTLESLKRLHDSINSAAMKELVQNLFNKILGNAGSIKVTRVFAVDICFMEFYQQCVLHKADISDNMSNNALLRNGKQQMEQIFKSDGINQSEKKKILLNAFKWRMAEDRKLFSRPDLEAFQILASVCRDWYKIAQDAPFKEAVRTARNLFKVKYETINLKCKARIIMNDEISCIASSLDYVFIVTMSDPGCVFLYDPYSTPHRDAHTSRMIVVGQADLEKIEIADGIDISSLESADDDSGLFCINRTDGSVWYWMRSEARHKAIALPHFSPCSSFTISSAPRWHWRIIVLKAYNAIEMYSPAFDRREIMILPDYVVKANDILCNDKGQLIVCYGSDTNPLHRVSVIYPTGLESLLTYGNERGSGANELNNPCSIALDQENEVLYVVDKGNERIVALDKNMNLINVVLDSKHNGMGSPTAVRFSNCCKRLLVAREKIVEVFKIKRKLQHQEQGMPAM